MSTHAVATLPGRKHRFPATQVNEDLAGSFDLDIDILLTNDGTAAAGHNGTTERVRAWFVADGHGERTAGSPTKDYVSRGTSYVRLMSKHLPSVLRSILTPFPTGPGASVSEELSRRFEDFRSRMNAACAGEDAEVCKQNGSTLCLSMLVGREDLFVYGIGDSSMCMVSDDGTPLRVWRRTTTSLDSNPPTPPHPPYPPHPPSTSSDPPVVEASRDEEVDPASDMSSTSNSSTSAAQICICEDTLDGFPKRLREGQDFDHTCKNFASLYPTKLHSLPDIGDFIPPGSVILPQQEKKIQDLYEKFPRINSRVKRSFLLISPESRYGLRMVNTLGNTDHVGSMISGVNFYHFPLSRLSSVIGEGNSKDPPNVNLIMVTDGVKDVLSTTELASLATCQDVVDAFQKLSHRAGTLKTHNSSLKFSKLRNTATLQDASTAVVNSYIPNQTIDEATRDATRELLGAHRSLHPEAEDIGSMEIEPSATNGDSRLRLAAISIVAAACFRNSGDDLTALVARIPLPRSSSSTPPSDDAAALATQDELEAGTPSIPMTMSRSGSPSMNETSKVAKMPSMLDLSFGNSINASIAENGPVSPQKRKRNNVDVVIRN